MANLLSKLLGPYPFAPSTVHFPSSDAPAPEPLIRHTIGNMCKSWFGTICSLCQAPVPC
jgi:hypothetical protein